jgi:hypothetical protein
MKIEFADQTIIHALEPYVQEVLDAVAVVTETPDITDAWVSDESMLSDFLCVFDNKEERARQVEELARLLGQPLPSDGRILIYEMALVRMRREPRM